MFDHLGAVFDGVEDPYLRERKGDLADVVGRLRMNLTPGAGAPNAAAAFGWPGTGFRDVLGECEAPCILVADELPPSIAAQLDWSKFEAFITDAGSRTYHTAILARSLHVPAVVGLHDATARILPGTLIVVDGDEGTVAIDVSPEIMESVVSGFSRTRSTVRLSAVARSTFSSSGETRRSCGEGGKADTTGNTPLKTADGVDIRVEANVDLLGDATFAMSQGAEGIGLFRSELLLAGRPADELTEDMQYEMYRQLLEDVGPAPVTVRTFDIDEDQLASGEHRRDTLWASGYEVPRTRLGLRSIRLTLKRRGLFRTQLRALVRAAVHGDFDYNVTHF